VGEAKVMVKQKRVMVQVGMGTSHVEVMAEVEARWNVIGRAVNNEMSKLKRK